MPRVGVFGGSFNPVHWGHLHIALLAREAAGLDEVVFVPAADPPHKDRRDLAPDHHRLKMLEAALRSESDTSISTIEIEDGGPRYTFETLAALARRRPRDELSFILGMDSLLELHAWRNPRHIVETYPVIAVDRPGFDPAAVDPELERYVYMVYGNPFAISSTGVRARTRNGLDISHLVPPPVAVYIAKEGLYAGQEKLT